MFYNNNLIKNLQFCFGLFLITVLILTSINTANAANTVVCPEELPVCNATTLSNYNTPVIGEEMETEIKSPAYSVGIQSITDAQIETKVQESTDLGTGDEELVPQATLPSNTSKSLDVPYINQYKDKNGNIWGTRYHCGAAAGTIVAGYFNKLPYKGSDDDLYKKYMNSNSGQGISETCNGQGGAFGITGYPDRSSSAYCRASYPDGFSKYLKKIGLKYKIVAGTGAGLGSLSIGTVKAAINRGNPIAISSGAHYYVIKGYTSDNKVIVNDSWKDGSKSGATGANTFVWGQGKNAVYDLKNLYPYQRSDYQDVRFAWEVSTSDTSFYNGNNKTETVTEKETAKEVPSKKATTVKKTPVTKADPIATQNGTQVEAKYAVDDSEGLNVRASAGGEIIDMVDWGTKGVITDGPKTAMGISWNKVKWENGLEGWSAKKYLSKITAIKTESINDTETSQTSNLKVEKPTEASIFTNIKLASDETKCLDLSNSRIAQNNIIQVWNCNDTIAQNFIMPNAETNPEGFGQIKLNTDQTFCIDFNGQYQSPSEGVKLNLSKCENGDKSSTEWMITEKGEIKPAYDDTLCIGLTANKTSKGNTFELQTCNDSQFQKFVM
jgi:Ricin-type beta-trefoil lectin domain/Peptidase_C39 like family